MRISPLAALMMIALAGCASLPMGGLRQDAAPTPAIQGPVPATAENVTALQEAVADSARSLVGRRRLSVEGRRYNFDCSGTILAAYHQAGVDLYPEFQRHSGNGVRRLYAIAETYPVAGAAAIAPGDLIFWDNTYDRNNNGAWDDPLTHAGIVVSVDPDGTISYVHHNYRRGIVVEQMNLAEPHNLENNSPMRMRGEPNSRGRWLSSHLFRSGGRPYMLLVE